MAGVISSSLFETGSEPVLERSVFWIESVMFGPVALILATLAFAVLGAIMLAGRLPTRRAFLVVVGCFVLFGAPALANSLMGLMGQSDGAGKVVPEIVEPSRNGVDRGLPDSDYDPYSGA